MTVTVVRDNVGLLLRGLLALSRQEVVVGVPQGSPRRDGGPDNATLAYIMETGDPSRNIPARPFMAPGMADAKPEIVAMLKAAGLQAVKDVAALKSSSQDGGPIAKGLHTVGLVAQKAIVAKMEKGPFVPPSPRTLRNRRKRGNTSTKPLLDTHQLERSVTYVVRDKKGR